MKLQLADPADHPDVGLLPFSTDLEDWTIPDIHPVVGLHRHVVRLVEVGVGPRRASYVVKELPDHLVLREYRMLRGLAEDRLPTAVVVAAVTGRTDHRDGLLVTRHLDYALPYRSLLSGRGLHIPYLGDRLLDALVGLLVRLHLAGFFWGDCSLSNTLFRRDAGALSAYVIDTETSERYHSLSDGQRAFDLQIATENVAGGLLDLQAGGRLVPDIDPWDIAERIETSYEDLWHELKAWEEFNADETWRVEERLERLHTLGFDVAEMDIVADEATRRVRLAPGWSRAAITRTDWSRSPGCGRGRTRPDACSRTSATSAPSWPRSPAPTRPRTWSRCVGSTSASSRRSAPCRVSCAASCRTPRSTTSTSSTVG